MVRSFLRVNVVLAFRVIKVFLLSLLMPGQVMNLDFCAQMLCGLLSLMARLVLVHGLLRLFLRSWVIHGVISFCW